MNYAPILAMALALPLGGWLDRAGAADPAPAGPATAPALPGSIHFTGGEGIGHGRHIVLLAGDEEYRSEEAMPMLAKILTRRHGFECTVLFPIDSEGNIAPANARSLPGAAALDSADGIVMLLRYRNWSAEQMKHFVAAVDRGVPIVALRTSTHAFSIPDGPYQSYSTFGKRVLGEGWVSHWGRHKFEATRGVIEPSAAHEPILNGITDVFGTTDVYEAAPPADAKVLLRGQVLRGMNPADAPAHYRKTRSVDHQAQDVNEPMMPIAWTRLVRTAGGAESRVLCTTMGAATDLHNESLRRLVINGVCWGLKLEVPASADVTVVDRYEPRDYGFNGYRHGLRPDDFALGSSPKER